MPRHKNNGEISVFNDYFDPKPIHTGDIITYLQHVKEGFWKEEVLQAREFGKGSKLYNEIKKKLTCVTVSGVFHPTRIDDNLQSHSGFICMDFDHLPNIEDLKKKLEIDEYTFAVFKSISGEGLAVFVKISKPEKHREYFTLLREYYREKFQVEADSKCINVSRLRGASYDPECFVNTDSNTWNKITGLKKAQKPKPSVNVIATRSDFDKLIKEINQKGIDITNGYENWLACGFALAEEFDEAGREYFHVISSVSPEYDPQQCDKQYDHCLRSDNGSKITIGTFYYFCKNQGLEISSNLTREAVNIVSVKRSTDHNKEEARKAIQHLDIEPEEIDYIVEEVYSSPINRQFSEELPLAERVELYLINTYNIRLNEMGNFVEIDGNVVDTRKQNQIWLESLKFVDEKTPQHLIRAALDSDKIKTYHPLREFFTKNESLNPSGNIDKLADSIPSDTAIEGMTTQEYKRLYLKKWLCGMIAGVFGDPNPLVLAMVGRNTGTGKTEFFRRLLPKELHRFYDEATLDDTNARDNITKLVKNMLIMDDEGNSKNYKEAQKFKSLTSKNLIKIRKLYNNSEEEFLRIATLGITSNEIEVIKENTNRRVIPIHVIDEIDFKKYNSIDKKSLIMEAYHVYKSGFDYLIRNDEIKRFNDSLQKHAEIDPYKVKIDNHIEAGLFAVPCATVFDYFTDNSRNHMSPVLMGKKMSEYGFERKQKRVEGRRQWCYLLSKESAEKILRTYNPIASPMEPEQSHEGKQVKIKPL